MKTQKICKGQNRAHGYVGCGKVTDVKRLKYGICPSCLIDWGTTTEGGKLWYSTMFLPKVKRVTQKEQRKKTNELKNELNTGRAMRLADMYFSRYIRLKHSFENDGITYCTCFTSGDIVPIKELDNGHFMKREHKATRYHEDNCRPQSKRDNGDTKHNGKQVEFKDNLIREIGEERVLEVERLAKTIIKADTYFYKSIADKYRVLVNDIQKERNIKIW